MTYHKYHVIGRFFDRRKKRGKEYKILTAKNSFNLSCFPFVLQKNKNVKDFFKSKINATCHVM